MTVLAYHAVDPSWNAPLSVPPETFAQHVEWLASARRCVPIAETPTSPSRRTVAVTFDDGFASVYEHAFPVLRRHAVPFTVFVIGRTLSDPRVDWVDRPPAHPLGVLDRRQILEMQAEGVAFGSHSYSHADLTTLGYERCLEDLRRSREVLEDLLGVEVRTLAYPRGRHDAEVRRAARDAGFVRGFGIPVATRDVGPLAVPRVGIYPTDRPLTLRVKASPWYGRVRGGDAYRTIRPLLQRA